MPRTGRRPRDRRVPRPRGRSPRPSCRSSPCRAAPARRTASCGTVPMRLSSMPRAILIAIGHLVRRSILPGSFLRSTLIGAAEHAVGPAQRVLEVVRGGEDRVDDPVVERLLGLQHPVLLERVRDHDLERVLDADEVRQQVRAAPAGDDAEEHLGQRDRGGRGIHRPVRRVQRDLESAAEREPVHERERRHAEVRELAEHVVAELRDQPRVVLRAERARCR